jgi:FkbM family methyltransferase
MKQLVQSFLRRFGYELRRAAPGGDSPVSTCAHLLETVPHPVVFDVGAHVGEITLACRARMPEARIFSFEPFPSSREILLRNIGGDPLTTVVPLAVSDCKGTSVFHSNKLDATNSLLPSSTSGGKLWGGVQRNLTTIPVETTTLDEAAAALSVERIDILKLDIQGGEYKALLGARRLLEEGRISIVWLEILAVPAYEGQVPAHELFHLLGSHGLILWDVCQLDRRAGRLYQMDAIFVQPRLLPENSGAGGS